MNKTNLSNDNILLTRCPGKRLSNELSMEWTNEFQNKKQIFYIDTTKNIMKFYMFFEQVKNPILISLKFWNMQYPFRPPQVFIGKNEYISLLPFQWKFANKLFGDKCPCCSTIVCKGNWGPQNKLSNITDEIRFNLNRKIRLVEIFLCKKIVDKHFGHYLPIEEFL